MLKVFGSKLCPDCVECIANFEFYKINYEYIDINESMKNLKEFLNYRDNNSIFKNSKELNQVGIPACIDENEVVFLDWDRYIKELGFDPIYTNKKQACSIDGKGC